VAESLDKKIVTAKTDSKVAIGDDEAGSKEERMMDEGAASKEGRIMNDEAVKKKQMAKNEGADSKKLRLESEESRRKHREALEARKKSRRSARRFFRNLTVSTLVLARENGAGGDTGFQGPARAQVTRSN